MNLGKISVRYGKALFQFAKEKNQLEKVSRDMELLYNSSVEVPEFRDFLNNPILPLSGKKNAIHKIFENKIDPLTIDFLDLIIKNNRLAFLEGITLQFRDQFNTYKGITLAKLTTVYPLDHDLRDKIIEFIKKKTTNKIILDEITDPEILGGFIIKIEDEQIDTSVRTQLNKIKKELTH